MAGRRKRGKRSDMESDDIGALPSRNTTRVISQFLIARTSSRHGEIASLESNYIPFACLRLLDLIHQIKLICCVEDFSFNTPSTQTFPSCFPRLAFFSFPLAQDFFLAKLIYVQQNCLDSRPKQFNSRVLGKTVNSISLRQ